MNFQISTLEGRSYREYIKALYDNLGLGEGRNDLVTKLGNILKKAFKSGFDHKTDISSEISTPNDESLSNMEETEIKEDDLLMDFESGIDTWIIDKEDTNASVLNVDMSLGVEMIDSVTMDKENCNSVENKALRSIKVSTLDDKDTSQIFEHLKRKTQDVETDVGHSSKKQKHGYDSLEIKCTTHPSSKSSYASKKTKDSLSSQEISSLLSEDSLDCPSIRRLHSIENVSDLVDKIKENGRNQFQVGEDRTDLLRLPVPDDSKIDYLDMYKNHLLIRNSDKSNALKSNPKNRHSRKVKNRHRKETLKCNLCIYYTTDCLVLETHKLLYHSTSTDLYCEDCNYHTSQVADLVTHIRTHYDYLDCPHCRFKGWTKQGMEGHLMKAHPKSINCFKCKNCNYSGKTKRKYQKHLLLHSKFQCADCNDHFTSKQTLEKHIKTHYKSMKTQNKCGECDLIFSSKFELKCHGKKSHSNHYTCSACNTKFTHKRFLKVHMKIHTSIDNCEEKSIKCDKCDSHFTRKNHLTLHFNNLTECFKCQYCSFQCNDSADLSNHTCINNVSNVEDQNFSNTEEDKCFAETVQELTLVDEPITNKAKKSTIKRRYNKKIYNLDRQKVLSLRHNLPSKRSQSQPVPDNQHISTNKIQLKGTQKRKFKISSDKQRTGDEASLKNRKNGTFKAISKQNQIHVIGSKIQKVGRGRPRKIKPQTKLIVPFSCEEMFFGEKPFTTMVDFIKPERLRNENYIQCFYQSHDPTFFHSHIERHVRPNTLLSCRFCRYKTNSEQLLQRHVEKYHTWDPALVNILFS